MLGLSQSIRNKKKRRQQYGDEREGERKKIDCQNVTRKNALNVTIIRGLTVITFPIYLDFLVLNSFQLSVWEMSPVEVFSSFLVKFQQSIIHQNWVGQYWECFYLSKNRRSLKLADFVYFYGEKASDPSLVVDKPLDQYSKIQSVLLLICIIYPILKSDKIIQQTWNAESCTEAVVVIKAMDKRHLSGNNLDWFKHSDFQGSAQELLAHDLGPTHGRIQAALI